MTARRPVIGLSTYDDVISWYAWDSKKAALVAEVYLDAVWAAGGAPIMLPSLLDPVDVIDRVDAVVLVGGPDVGAERYGSQPHERTHPSSARRDEFELKLIDASCAAAVPLLGICRGAQLLNVARRGTLHQHLPELLGHEGHSPGHGTYGATPVRVDAASRLAGALGSTELTVECFHHQAVDQLGQGLTVSAWAEDGTIEAIEDPAHRFVLGVQWHPEESRDRRLFGGLVEAAKAHSAKAG